MRYGYTLPLHTTVTHYRYTLWLHTPEQRYRVEGVPDDVMQYAEVGFTPVEGALLRGDRGQQTTSS